jgi:ABC-type transport system involved in multi-copper enzyme maturation permease subunit
MLESFLHQLGPCFGLTLIQFLAALPWLWALDSRAFRTQIRTVGGWLRFLAAIGGVTVLLSFFLAYQRGASMLELYGRFYGSLLHLQLIIDFFVIAFQVILLAWPKGGAVALSAFREGVRQPMFWLIGGAAVMLLAVAMVIPYFTFGDDYKMMKQICFDVAMLSSALFGVLGASISINEEIEGRTAITLMSKPVTRRQFLLGKYLGILLASLLLSLLIGWWLNWALHIQPRWNPLDDVIDPMPTQISKWLTDKLMPTAKLYAGADATMFLDGALRWTGEALANNLGLLLCFGQVMVLIAIASTLATRIPMAANLILTLVLFFLGNLAPVLSRASDEWKAQHPSNPAVTIVNFLTKLLETFTPSLDLFNMGPAIIRDTPIDVGPFALYAGSVLLYATVYTAIALLFGLILFEDRDLA